jgi:hypothetical protein
MIFQHCWELVVGRLLERAIELERPFFVPLLSRYGDRLSYQFQYLPDTQIINYVEISSQKEVCRRSVYVGVAFLTEA